MAAERHGAAFVVGAVLGGLAGAAGTLWRAPQAGARTRGQIGERWDEATERVAQGVADVDARVRDLLDRDAEPPPVVVRPAETGGGSEAPFSGAVVAAEPTPPGPRPGPIVGGTVVAEPGLAPPGDPVPPIDGPPTPAPTGGIDPRAGTG